MFGVIVERPLEEDILKIHDFFDLVIRSTFGKNGLGELKEIIQEEKTYKRSCLREDFDSLGKERYFLIAKLGDEIVGTIEYGPSNEIVRNHDEALSDVKEVGTVYVHPEYQGQGIGRQLLDAIGRSLLDAGYDKLVMDSGYPSAQVIWTKKFGQPFHQLVDYWGPNGDHMIWLIEASELVVKSSDGEISGDSELIQPVLTMKVLEESLAVCRLDQKSEIPSWVMASSWFSISKTDEELSIVCESKLVPEGEVCEKDWAGIKVIGPLVFSMVGILARLSTSLANAGVSIFAISTYDTDYLLVKRDKLDEAVKALTKDGINFL